MCNKISSSPHGTQHQIETIYAKALEREAGFDTHMQNACCCTAVHRTESFTDANLLCSLMTGSAVNGSPFVPAGVGGPPEASAGCAASTSEGQGRQVMGGLL